MNILKVQRAGSGIFTILLACGRFAQAASNVQRFPLSSTKDLIPVNAKAEAVEYKGRKCVRVRSDLGKDGFTLLRVCGTDFPDGTIEADVALKITKTTTPGGRKMPGYSGIAFRGRPNASRYELFYLRPGNSRSDDQTLRNHSLQYTSEPGFGWYKLRRGQPWVYEAYTPLQLETWIKVRIEVKGRSAKLYLNGCETSSLVMDALLGQGLCGGVALWGHQGEEAYFSNVRIVNSTPLPVKNGSDPSGIWQMRFTSGAGVFKGTLQLKRDASKVTETWSGDLGHARPVTGTWRDGYVELSFDAQWKFPHLQGNGTAMLASWIDGDSRPRTHEGG